MSNNNKFVSIVEDDLDISVLFQQALCGKIEGASVVSFNDPVTALKHYTKNKQQYAVVISDMRMSSINGLELLKKVKKLNPKIRTIIVTGFEFENNPVFETYLKQGIIDSFIVKPVRIDRLCQSVRDEFAAYQSTSNYKR
jgi:DNA-binding NtrC family response regulator